MATRSQLEARAHQRALSALMTERPSRGTPEGERFWGARCEQCGIERPKQEVYGAVCSCEDAEFRRIKEEDIEGRRPALTAAILERARIPDRYALCTFDDFEPRVGVVEGLDTTRDWADTFDLDTKRGLLLVGPYGSGKTHLAVAALGVAVKRALVEARFIAAGDLVLAVRSGETGVTWRAVEGAIAVELLLLDDLGQEVGTEFARDVLARVIVGRYDSNRPTLLTSNLGPKALTEVLGGQIVSRLHEMTDVQLITASDYRVEGRTVRG